MYDDLIVHCESGRAATRRTPAAPAGGLLGVVDLVAPVVAVAAAHERRTARSARRAGRWQARCLARRARSGTACPSPRFARPAQREPAACPRCRLPPPVHTWPPRPPAGHDRADASCAGRSGRCTAAASSAAVHNNAACPEDATARSRPAGHRAQCSQVQHGPGEPPGLHAAGLRHCSSAELHASTPGSFSRDAAPGRNLDILNDCCCRASRARLAAGDRLTSGERGGLGHERLPGGLLGVPAGR